MKLSEFTRLAQTMATATGRLDRLGGELAFILAAAGVSTAPATTVQSLASWAGGSAADLRRRVQLAQDMEGKGFALSRCRIDGMYVVLPDRFADQTDDLRAHEAAGLLPKAGAGDSAALSRLATLLGGTPSQYLTRTLLQLIGADGLVRLPAQLVHQIHLDADQHDRHPRLARDSRNTVVVLQAFARMLAQASTPALAPDLLPQLTKLGRSRIQLSDGDVVYGYQSLATLLEYLQGRRGLPAAFFHTVGSDMLAFDRSRPYFPSLPLVPADATPLPDLGQHENVGLALSPTPTMTGSGYNPRTDFLVPLLKAAQSAGAAQALLNAAPGTLNYLLLTRAPRWNQSDHGAALGGLLERAMSGTDPAAKALYNDLITTLGTAARTWFATNVDNVTAIGIKAVDLTLFHQLSGLMAPLGQVLAARMDVNFNILNGSPFSGASDSDPANIRLRNLFAVVALATSSDDGFAALTRGELLYGRMLLQTYMAHGIPLDGPLTDLGRMVGMTVDLRTAIHKATAPDERDDSLGSIVAWASNAALGALPTPLADVTDTGYGSRLRNKATGAIHDYVNSTYSKLAAWLGDQTSTYTPPTANPFGEGLSDTYLSSQLLAKTLYAAIIPQLQGEQKYAPGATFAKGGKITPPSTWTPVQVRDFYGWLQRTHPEWSRDARELSNSSNDYLREAYITFSSPSADPGIP